MSQTIRINPDTRTKLKDIAKAESTTLIRMLDKVVEAYRRKQLIEKTNAAFAALKKNPKAWQQELKERRQWDITLSDDLEDDAT